MAIVKRFLSDPLFLSESAFRLAYSAYQVATVVRFMRVNWKTYNPGPFFDEIISSPGYARKPAKSSPAIFVR